MYWIVGQTYLVLSENGCTVQFADGAHVKTVPAGEPTLVVAQTHDMVVTDAKATVRRMPNGCDLLLGEMFNGAPVGALPAGYTRLDFLESTGEPYIDTGVKLSNESEVVCEYLINQNTAVNAIFGARDDYSLNAYCFYSPNSSGNIFYIYGANGASSNLDAPAVNERYKASTYNGVLTVNGTSAKQVVSEAFTSAYSCLLFAVSTKGSHGSNPKLKGRIYNFSISRSGVRQLNVLPCLDDLGTPCMYDTVTRQPFYNQGTGAFIAGLTAAQAVQLANLPTGGGALTVSLPQSILNDSGKITDAAVRAALNKAAENGWTITLQYYTN